MRNEHIPRRASTLPPRTPAIDQIAKILPTLSAAHRADYDKEILRGFNTDPTEPVVYSLGHSFLDVVLESIAETFNTRKRLYDRRRFAQFLMKLDLPNDRIRICLSFGLPLYLKRLQNLTTPPQVGRRNIPMRSRPDGIRYSENQDDPATSPRSVSIQISMPYRRF